MELIEDKEKIRRAYLRAKKMELAVSIQEQILDELKDPLLSTKEETKEIVKVISFENADIELKALAKKSTQKQLSTTELERFIQLADHLKKTNLIEEAERILCVRKSESMDAIPRLQRPVVPFNKIVGKCIAELSLNEKKFLSSYVHIAPWMHYFSRKDSLEFRILKKRDWILDPCLRSIFVGYKNMDVKFPPEVLMQTKLFNTKFFAESPSLYPNVPDNNWGKVFASFSQLLGFNHVETILTDLKAGFENKEFRNWLQRSDKSVRLNWHQLQSAYQNLSQEEAVKLLGCFISRFASLACRDGSLSLWTLSQSGAPVELLCDLEGWFLNS